MFLRNKDQLRSILLLYGCMAFLGGCATTASVPPAEPEFTTYPRDRITQENVRMVLTPPVGARSSLRVGDFGSRLTQFVGQPSSEFEQTEIGDTAVHEVRIIPDSGRHFGPQPLYAQIPQRGAEVCGDDYRVQHSQYFLPSEGTSRFLGITVPWLQVTFRCPVLVETEFGEAGQALLELSSLNTDWAFFDINRQSFPMRRDAVVQYFREAVEARGLEVSTEQTIENRHYLLTNTNRRGLWGFPTYERIFAVFVEQDNETEVAFQLFATYPSVAESPHISRLGGFGYHGLVPVDRNIGYRSATLFWGEFITRLPAQVQGEGGTEELPDTIN